MGEEKKAQAPQQNAGDLLQVRRDKLAALQAAGEDPFQQTKFDFNCTTERVRAEFDALEDTTVRLAGRMMSKRVMGKVSFCDLQDSTGRLQLYVRRDELGEEDYAKFKKLDIGDWQPSEQRVFGYLGERLLDVWLAANDIRYKDIPYMFMEKQHWPTKIKNFLKRKFAGKGGGK